MKKEQETPDEGIDTAMVALLKRGVRGDPRHQYTAEQLRERNPEAYQRLMARAESEVRKEDGGDSEDGGMWR